MFNFLWNPEHIRVNHFIVEMILLLSSKMDRKNYFQKLTETSEKVTPIIFEFVNRENFQEPVKSFIRKLPDQRARKPRLRDLLLRLSYEISGGKKWQEEILSYAAAIELYNNSTYIINWFLDGKGDLKTKNDEKSAVNAGFLLRELAQKVIQQREAPADKTLEIICGLAEVNSQMYEGQNLDLYILTVDRFHEFQDQEVFLNLLYEKGRLACGNFSAWITDIGTILAGNNDYKKILREFALDLSSGIQLANDAGDFVPSCDTVNTPDKSYKDQVTDIKNGRLTLSTWYCLKYGTAKQKRDLLNLVGKENVLFDEQEKALYALKDCGAFNFVLGEANRLMRQCKKTLHQLPKSEEREMLSTMASLIRSNKFYATLRERYGVKIS